MSMDKSIFDWTAMRPIELPRGNKYIKYLVERGLAADTSNDIKAVSPEGIKAQPMHKPIFAVPIMAKLEIKGLGSTVAK